MCSMDVLLSHVRQLPLTSKHYLLDEPVIQFSLNRTKKSMSQLASHCSDSLDHISRVLFSDTHRTENREYKNRFDADVITHLSKSLITATYYKADFGVVPKFNIYYTLTALFCVKLPGTLVSLVT